MTSIDVHYGKRLIVTGDSDGLIKLWNYKKQLIREVKFTEPVSAVCFQNEQGDLLVGHEGKLSRIEAQNYLPKTTVIDPREKIASGFEVKFNEIIERGCDLQLTNAEILEEMKNSFEVKSPVERICKTDDDLFHYGIPNAYDIHEFTSKIKGAQYDEFVKKLHEMSIEASDTEFKKLKDIQEEPYKLDLQMLKQPTPSAKKTPVAQAYTPAPKFGMPTELFKDCI